MSGARNYLALVARFPEGTVPKTHLVDGGAKVDLSEGEIVSVAFGGSVEEAAAVLADRDPKPGKVAIDQRLGNLERAAGHDGVKLLEHNERLVTLERAELARRLAAVEESLVQVEALAQLLDERIASERGKPLADRVAALEARTDVLTSRSEKHGGWFRDIEDKVGDAEEKLERLSGGFAPTSLEVVQGAPVAKPCGTFSAQALLARRETFGAMLRRTRLTAGLSLRDMAEHMGFRVSSVSDAERNDRRLTDAELERWAEAIGHDVEELEPAQQSREVDELEASEPGWSIPTTNTQPSEEA